MDLGPRRSVVIVTLAGLALLVAVLLLRGRQEGTPPPPPRSAEFPLPAPGPRPRAATPSAPVGPGSANAADPTPVLRGLQGRFATGWPKMEGHGWFGFRHRWRLGLCAVRLVALVHPEETLRWAREELAAPGRTELDRLFCVLVLRGMAETPHPGARDVLAGLLLDPRREVGQAAAGALLEADPAHAPRDAFLQAAMSGNKVALDAFSSCREPDVPALLQGLKAGAGDPESERALRIEDALAKQALLQAPAWPAKVIGVMNAETTHSKDQQWVLRVVQATRQPDLVAALDRRFTGVETLAGNRHADQQKLLPEAKRTEFGTVFEQADTLLIHDAGYDQGLLALRAAGGPLSELRRRRLRYAGYDVDPARRLSELAGDPEWSGLLSR